MDMQSRIARLMARIIAWRVPLLIVGIALGSLAYLPSKKLAFDRAIENMFAPSDPLLPPFQKLKRTFGGNEVILAAYVDPQLMSKEGMHRLSALSKKLNKFPECCGTGRQQRAARRRRHRLAESAGPIVLELFEGYTIGADRKTVGVACLLDPDSGVPRSRSSTNAAARRSSTIRVACL